MPRVSLYDNLRWRTAGKESLTLKLRKSLLVEDIYFWLIGTWDIALGYSKLKQKCITNRVEDWYGNGLEN